MKLSKGHSHLRHIAPVALALALSLPLTTSARAQAKTADKVKTYAISGSSGFELYTSIGERGPKGAIAQTAYALTWRRLFDEEGGSCRLVSARPELAIIYTFPKPSGKLSPKLRTLWNWFISGVRTHEEKHARMIREMVAETARQIAGASVANDRNCAKVKREVSRQIEAAKEAYKERSRQFDRVELSEGGNVHRLILALVNEQ